MKTEEISENEGSAAQPEPRRRIGRKMRAGKTGEGEKGMTRRKVYCLLLAVLLAALAALLSVGAVRIWREGSARKAENPLDAVYSPERVEEQLRGIRPLLYAVIGMAAAGLALGIRGGEGARPVSLPETERDLLVSRLREAGGEIRKERKTQRLCRWIRRAGFAACMIPILAYCADRGHFPENELENMIASLVLFAAPWTLAGLAVLLGGTLLEERSIRREIGAARAQLKAQGNGPMSSAGAGGKVPDRGLTAARIMLLAAAAALIVLGALNGSLKDVLMKAINICTECIGLG